LHECCLDCFHGVVQGIVDGTARLQQIGGTSCCWSLLHCSDHSVFSFVDGHSRFPFLSLQFPQKTILDISTRLWQGQASLSMWLTPFLLLLWSCSHTVLWWHQQSVKSAACQQSKLRHCGPANSCAEVAFQCPEVKFFECLAPPQHQGR